MNDQPPKAQVISFVCPKEQNDALIVDLIAEQSELSKSLIKKLMTFGAVFRKNNSKRLRVRKAKTEAKTGDKIECFFDPKIPLDQNFIFELLYSNRHYGIYFKPAGALSQGTNYGDGSSLVRSVEKEKRNAYLINRLDKETAGLVLVAYDSKSQNKFQEIWKEKVIKSYQAIVKGNLEGEGNFKTKVDGRQAETKYQVIQHHKDQTFVDVQIITGRKHQIRIHFANHGYPIMGDPKYGENNKNKDGMKLLAYKLEFEDPYSKKNISVTLPKEKLLF